MAKRAERIHRIALPTSFRAHTLKAVLERVRFFPDEHPEGFDLQFNRSYEYMEPVAGERAALHAELDASIAEADAGGTEDFAKVLTELRQRL